MTMAIVRYLFCTSGKDDYLTILHAKGRRETRNARDGEWSNAEMMRTDVVRWFKIIDNEHFFRFHFPWKMWNTEFTARHTLVWADTDMGSKKNVGIDISADILIYTYKSCVNTKPRTRGSLKCGFEKKICMQRRKESLQLNNKLHLELNDY